MAAQATTGLGLSADELDRWPGRERRHPSRAGKDYLVLAPLAAQLAAAARSYAPERTGLAVLDVGCGEKPYLPLFAARAASYTGFDVAPGPGVDDVGVAERLPYEAGRFDVVLCTQVLEHVDEPGAVVGEIRRVLAPGGMALLSTHGSFVFHPSPPPDRDYWRWTHAGLERVFRGAGEWAELSVSAHGEYISCLAYLAAHLVETPLQRVGPRTRGAFYRALNATAAYLDRRALPATLRVPHPLSLTANYLVRAVRPA